MITEIKVSVHGTCIPILSIAGCNKKLKYKQAWESHDK